MECGRDDCEIVNGQIPQLSNLIDFIHLGHTPIRTSQMAWESQSRTIGTKV